jgi:hypothetical protein
MSKLVAFAENKDALGFKEALHARIAEKVTAVLDALREKVATDLFNEGELVGEGSEEARQKRAKRMFQKKKSAKGAAKED